MQSFGKPHPRHLRGYRCHSRHQHCSQHQKIPLQCLTRFNISVSWISKRLSLTLWRGRHDGIWQVKRLTTDADPKGPFSSPLEIPNMDIQILQPLCGFVLGGYESLLLGGLILPALWRSEEVEFHSAKNVGYFAISCGKLGYPQQNLQLYLCDREGDRRVV